MEIADEHKYDFDPLDASKIFPEDQFPLQPVGRMVLDRNIDNFFNEQEMVAFNPGVVPPGGLVFKMSCFAFAQSISSIPW